MWVPYNPNPLGRRTVDCTVRAFAKAMDMSWDEAYLWIALEGFIQKSMPSDNGVWGMAFWRKWFEPYIQNQVNMLNLSASQTAQTASLVADNAAQTQYLISKLTPTAAAA